MYIVLRSLRLTYHLSSLINKSCLYSNGNIFVSDPQHTVFWRNNTIGIWIGSIPQTIDPRVNKLPNNTLEIRQVAPTDSGIYLCQVPVSAETTVQVTHTLHVISKCVEYTLNVECIIVCVCVCVCVLSLIHI